MRRRLFRLRVAFAEGRLIYCDYEGPHALSVTELSSLGMTGDEISGLVFEEARIAVGRRFGPLRVGLSSRLAQNSRSRLQLPVGS